MESNKDIDIKENNEEEEIVDTTQPEDKGSQMQQELINELTKMRMGGSKKKGQEEKDQYIFWDTQPVPKINQDVTETGPIDTQNDVSKERQEPYKLPAKFSWYEVDINNDSDLTKVTINLNVYNSYMNF
jgi:glycylpeptide N-tetradecanoyltransferase